MVLLLAACSPVPEIRSENYLQDSSFLTDDPCGAPCWRGITPGETEWEDAVALIQDDPTLNQFQQEADDETEALGAIWGQVDGERCCQMFSEFGDVVEFIILQTTPENTFGEVIEKYGEPDYLIGQLLAGDQGIFSVFYVDVPMLIYVFIGGEDETLAESNEVVGFAYTTEENMQTLLETSELHAWEGFQTYSAYMEGELEITPASEDNENTESGVEANADATSETDAADEASATEDGE